MSLRGPGRSTRAAVSIAGEQTTASGQIAHPMPFRAAWRGPHAHYEGADLGNGPGRGWNPFVFVGGPDGNGWILRERTARDQAIERRSRYGR
jgi:hypothetical protein